MATYSEYYEDFQSDTLIWREKLAITPRQYMRWIVDGMQKIQRRTSVKVAKKTLTQSSGTYAIGDDVLEIQTLVDADNREIVLTSLTQNQMIRDQEPIGLNEVPFNFSLKRDDKFLDNWGYEARVAVLTNANTIQVYPDPASDITMNYVVDIHRFSQASSQWSPWFASEAAFENLFRTTQIDNDIFQFDEGFQAYALMKYHIAIHNADWQIYAQMWKDALVTIQSNKQNFYVNGVAPYNLGPIQ